MAPYNPPLSNYAHINVKTLNENVIQKIMGLKGSWFKKFTELSQLKYVWYNSELKVIELWGSHENIEMATPIIKSRISMLTKYNMCI